MANEERLSDYEPVITTDGEYAWPKSRSARGLVDGQNQSSGRSAVLKAILMRMAVGLGFAGTLWVLDLQFGAALVLVAVLALSLLSIVFPAAGTRIDVGIARVTAPIVRSVSTITLAIMYFLVITPVSVGLRLVGRDPLAPPIANVGTAWIAKPRQSVPAMVHRQFTVEERVLLRRPQGRTAAIKFLVSMTVRAISLFVAVDLVIGTVYVLVRAPGACPHARLSANPALADDKWAADYFREFCEMKADWVPLLGMVLEDHEGVYFNIVDRARKTYVAHGVDDDAPSLFFFGGSTTWGEGQRDSYTIPSYVARLAEEHGVSARVSNYGQSGWVIWQELALLQQLLTEGNVPDVAIFYNGHNDVGLQVQELTTAPSYPRAELIKQAVNRERARGSFSGFIDALNAFYLDHSILVRIVRKFTSPEISEPAPTSASPQVQARNAVELHDRAVEVIEGLAKSYGFEAVFFWQPDAYTTDGGDAARFLGWGEEGFGAAYLEATRSVGPPVINLADALDGVQDAVFFDDVHTNELGAELVARAIYPHLGLKH